MTLAEPRVARSPDGAVHPEKSPSIRRRSRKSGDGAADLEKSLHIPGSRSTSADVALYPQTEPSIHGRSHPSGEVAADPATARRLPGICGDVWRFRHVRRGKRGERDGHAPPGMRWIGRYSGSA